MAVFHPKRNREPAGLEPVGDVGRLSRDALTELRIAPEIHVRDGVICTDDGNLRFAVRLDRAGISDAFRPPFLTE